MAPWPQLVGGLLLLGQPTAAAALPGGSIAGDPVTLDVTEAASLTYHIDNRDDGPGEVSTRANDDWGAWVNRFNAQARWRRWQLALRIDSALFYTAPDPTAIGLDLVQARPGGTAGDGAPEFFRSKVNEAGVELSNRYINWVYPAKVSLGYTTRDIELTVGDFYAQLGRGFVLSVRKLDELASDTTVRGARVTRRLRAGDLRLRATALAGTMNPLRVDEASGRYLGVDKSAVKGLAVATEAGMPRAITTDFVPERSDCAALGTCTYAPDHLVAGQIELGPAAFKLGTQASVLIRTDADPSSNGYTPLNPDIVRSSSRIVTASQFVDIPALTPRTAAYLEAALQSLHADTASESMPPGYALYASASYVAPQGSLLFEGKHYRRFFPLSANAKLGRAREFSLLQYNSPPTTNAYWVDTEFEGFNTCVTGGRLKGDWHTSEDTNVFAWLGRYSSFAESVTNERCAVSRDKENRVWDAATGLEITSQERKSRANLTFGARFDDTAREKEAFGTCTDPVTGRLSPCIRGTTTVFYREAYARYDAIRWISGPYSLKLQGWHRRRHQTLGGPPDPWLEGQHLTGFEWAGHLSLAFGVEYDTNPQTPDTYLNGQAVYQVTDDTNVSLFAGQRRGTLRCVSGVCRIAPPFEGARLDITVRL